MLQILAEIGAAIAGKAIGQQMRIGGDICFKKGSQFGARGCRQHGDAGIAGEEPVLALDGVAMFAALVLRAPVPFRLQRRPGSCRDWRYCDRDWSGRRGHR